MATEAQLEVLSDALNTALLQGDFHTTEHPRAWIKADNRLLDACIDAGMDRETVFHREWAAERIAAWLVSGNECDCGASIDDDETLCRSCHAEYRAEMACASEEF